MADEPTFTVTLEHLEGYAFRLSFDDTPVAPITVDEPPPLGKFEGPNPSRLIAAGVANCLAASLLFCLQKTRQPPASLRAVARGRLVRNAKGRLRLGGIDVTLQLETGEGGQARLERCAELFEDYCVVTESIRQGVPVAVRIADAGGRTLFERA
jgi:organic hydroperoxide reductase OsmC/OhrA